MILEWNEVEWEIERNGMKRGWKEIEWAWDGMVCETGWI